MDLLTADLVMKTIGADIFDSLTWSNICDGRHEHWIHMNGFQLEMPGVIKIYNKKKKKLSLINFINNEPGLFVNICIGPISFNIYIFKACPPPVSTIN